MLIAQFEQVRRRHELPLRSRTDDRPRVGFGLRLHPESAGLQHRRLVGILTALEEEAVRSGVERMFLEVRVSNAAAMLLYLKHGYVGRYVRPRYYGDGEDALIMEKPLKKRQE